MWNRESCRRLGNRKASRYPLGQFLYVGVAEKRVLRRPTYGHTSLPACCRHGLLSGTPGEERRVHERPVQRQGVTADSIVGHTLLDAQPHARRLLRARRSEAADDLEDRLADGFPVATGDSRRCDRMSPPQWAASR